MCWYRALYFHSLPTQYAWLSVWCSFQTSTAVTLHSCWFAVIKPPTSSIIYSNFISLERPRENFSSLLVGARHHLWFFKRSHLGLNPWGFIAFQRFLMHTPCTCPHLSLSAALSQGGATMLFVPDCRVSFISLHQNSAWRRPISQTELSKCQVREAELLMLTCVPAVVATNGNDRQWSAGGWPLFFLECLHLAALFSLCCLSWPHLQCSLWLSL